MVLHRIALASRAATPAEAFSGRGGLFGKGRWHAPNRLIVYTSTSVSLAMAEVLVHLRRSNHLEPYFRWEIDVPEKELAEPPALPPDWKTTYSVTQAIGNAWLDNVSSVGLLVPSALVPSELNCLLNPRHPRFKMEWIKLGPIPFPFDSRLTTNRP